MKVFVVGTGRCGTTTFVYACKHITNYKCVHEQPVTSSGGSIKFPMETERNVIYVDPRLSFAMPLIPNDAFIVHLRRKREEVINSWIKRGKNWGPRAWLFTAFHWPAPSFSECCALCYDVMVRNIEAELALRESCGQRISMTLHLESIKTRWMDFWRTIKAEGDYKESLAEWDRKHNATPTRE